MLDNITDALHQIKTDVARALEAALIVRVCAELGPRWRDREFDPVATRPVIMFPIC